MTLTEAELREAIEQAFIADPKIYINTDKNGDLVMPEKAINRILTLITTQKKAWADYVIGEDEYIDYSFGVGDDRPDIKNELRADQRKRNESGGE
jgi:hypothetical protein